MTDSSSSPLNPAIGCSNSTASSEAAALNVGGEEFTQFVNGYRQSARYFCRVSTTLREVGDLPIVRLPVNVLIDRGTRKQSRLTVAPVLNVGKPFGRNRGAAPAATHQYHHHLQALEIQGISDEFPRSNVLATSITSILGVSAAEIHTSLILTPLNCASSASTELDTVLFILTGNCTICNVLLTDDITSTANCAYIPAGSSWTIIGQQESRILKISITPRSLLNLVVDELTFKLSNDPQLQQNSKALVGVDQETRDRLLNLAIVKVKAALDDIHGHLPITPKLLNQSQAQPRSPKGNLVRRHIDRNLYAEKEWCEAGVKRRQDDIHIVTYKRSGTTWMQMILFQLLTKGDIDSIAHIYEFSPYVGFELRFLGTSKRIEKLPSPRVLKTHAPLPTLYSPQGCFIYVARDGLDVAISSYYHHIEMGNGPIPLQVYLDRFLTEKPGWFEHVSSAWRLRDRQNVLFLTYRDLVNNLRQCIETISQFCGVSVTPEKIASIEARCSFDYMKRNETKFHHSYGARWLAEQRSSLGFIRKGGFAKDREMLTPDQVAQFQRKYSQVLGDVDRNLNL